MELPYILPGRLEKAMAAGPGVDAGESVASGRSRRPRVGSETRMRGARTMRCTSFAKSAEREVPSPAGKPTVTDGPFTETKELIGGRRHGDRGL